MTKNLQRQQNRNHQKATAVELAKLRHLTFCKKQINDKKDDCKIPLQGAIK